MQSKVMIQIAVVLNWKCFTKIPFHCLSLANTRWRSTSGKIDKRSSSLIIFSFISVLLLIHFLLLDFLLLRCLVPPFFLRLVLFLCTIINLCGYGFYSSGVRNTSTDLRTVICVTTPWMDLVGNRDYNVFVSQLIYYTKYHRADFLWESKKCTFASIMMMVHFSINLISFNLECCDWFSR